MGRKEVDSTVEDGITDEDSGRAECNEVDDSGRTERCEADTADANVTCATLSAGGAWGTLSRSTMDGPAETAEVNEGGREAGLIGCLDSGAKVVGGGTWWKVMGPTTQMGAKGTVHAHNVLNQDGRKT